VKEISHGLFQSTAISHHILGDSKLYMILWRILWRSFGAENVNNIFSDSPPFLSDIFTLISFCIIAIV
jgi:hypothetical protein